MKKSLMPLILIVSIIAIAVVFGGCAGNFSAKDIVTLYNSLKSGENTSQFFDGDNVIADFSDVEITNADASYILLYAYQPLLDVSTAFVSSRFKTSQLEEMLNLYTPSQRNIIYKDLKLFGENLNNFAKIKNVFVRSEGTLQFTKLLNAYNKLLDSAFALNTNYANILLFEQEHSNFASPDVTVTRQEADDYLMFNAMLLGECVYRYNVLNYEPTNPLTNISAWQANNSYFASFLNLKTGVDAALVLESDISAAVVEDVKSILKNLQSTNASFVESREVFFISLNNFNYKTYFAQTNKAIFLESCTDVERAYFDVALNFLHSKYQARFNGIETLLETFRGISI